MEREAVAVAVPVAEDLGPRVGASDERIVRRHAAVLREPQRLAHVVREALRPHADARVVRRAAAEPVAVAHRDVERAVRAEQHAARRGVARLLPGVRHEDLAHVHEPVAFEPPAGDREREAALAFLRIGRVDVAVAREVGVQDHVVQHVVARRRRREPRGLGQELAATHDAQAPGALRHEQRVAVRQERDAPGAREPARHERHADALAPCLEPERLAGLRQSHPRLREQRRGREEQRREQSERPRRERMTFHDGLPAMSMRGAHPKELDAQSSTACMTIVSKSSSRGRTDVCARMIAIRSSFASTQKWVP